MNDIESNFESLKKIYGDKLEKKEDVEIISTSSDKPYSYEYDMKCEECYHVYSEGPTSFKTSFTCPECGSTMYRIIHLIIHKPDNKYGPDKKYPTKK